MNISRQSGERREPGARVESELQHFVLLFLAMHEREREGEKPVDIFNVESQRLVNGCHPLERPDLQPARDKDLMPVTQICSLT